MKKALFSTSIMIFFIVLAGTISHMANKKHSLQVTGGDGDDMEDYYKWEVQRLADPATGKIPDNIRNLELKFAAGLPNDLKEENNVHQATSVSWQMRGPWNVGGRTRAFAADVKNEAILLAGTTAGGMWRSADSGKTWALTTPLPQEQSVSCLAQDTRNLHSNIWYYGSGECYGTSASATGAFYLGNGVYRSKDNGQTWSVLTKTSVNNVNFVSYWQAIWSVATDPSVPDSLSVVYVSTIGEVNRSSDTGNTWKTVLGGGSYYTNVIVTPEGVVYATMSSDGSQKGIWRSVDGVHYTKITPPGFPTTYNRIVMCYAPANHNQLYFLANTPGFGTPDTNFLKQVEWNSLWKYKYLSGNGDSAGGSWWNLSANLPHSGSLFDKYNCQGSYDMVVSFLPTDTATVFIGGTDIFRSTSGFFDYTHSAHIGGYGVGTNPPNIKVYPGHHPDQHVLFFSKSNPYIMYSGCDGGIFKTLNDTAVNVPWTTFDYGYVTTMFYTVTSNHATSGSPILVAGAQDNDCLYDNALALTNSWTKPIFGDGSFCNIADSGKTFYYEITTGKLFKAQMDTTNGTVVAFRRIDPIGGKNYQWLNPSVVDPNNNYIMYLAGGKYLWRNSNLSAIPLNNMWDSISTNWVQWTDSVPTAGQYISAMAVSTIPANRVYYGTTDRNVYRIDNANVGTPVPTDITGTVSPNQFPNGSWGNAAPFVTCIAVDPNNADNLIVVFSNYGPHNLFYSSNGGTTWTYSTGNLAGANQPSLRWAAIQHLPSGGTIYWLAASTGLYATDSLKGTSTIWVQQAAGTIGNSVCDMVDVRQSDGLVAVATHTRGVYTANVTSLNDIATVRNLSISNATDIQINVYPNPFTERASVSFTLPDDVYVQLKIFDGQGKLVKQVAGSYMQAGEHTITFDAQNQPGGLYFCSLQAGNEIKTSRIVLVK